MVIVGLLGQIFQLCFVGFVVWGSRCFRLFS